MIGLCISLLLDGPHDEISCLLLIFRAGHIDIKAEEPDDIALMELWLGKAATAVDVDHEHTLWPTLGGLGGATLQVARIGPKPLRCGMHLTIVNVAERPVIDGSRHQIGGAARGIVAVCPDATDVGVEHTDDGAAGQARKQRNEIVRLGGGPITDTGHLHLHTVAETHPMRRHLTDREDLDTGRQLGSALPLREQRVVVAVRNEDADAGLGQFAQPEDDPPLCAGIALGRIEDVSGEHDELDPLAQRHLDEPAERCARQADDAVVRGGAEQPTEGLQRCAEVEVGGVEKPSRCHVADTTGGVSVGSRRRGQS
uniref:Unannotated protein n=1 Tax=freshwater metagenome TaxID=449393 RepID=A0A6J7MTT7_9ZZZZ